MIDVEATVALDKLAFDKQRQHGQIRKLDPAVVAYYFQRLLSQGPPPVPPMVPLKKLPGINFQATGPAPLNYFSLCCR